MTDFKLSDFKGLGGLEIKRDGIFHCTGKLSTQADGLCVPLRSEKYVDDLNANLRAVAVITTPEIAERVDDRFAIALSDDPDSSHADVHAACAEIHAVRLREQSNKIDESAEIDPSASIAAYGVEIGARTSIGANVVIAPGTVIAHDCVIHSGTVVGVSGFNAAIIAGRRRIIAQVGGVRIGPFVELLANCCIARASFVGDTVIGEETIADNLVYIAHDVQIGRRVQICALANILGRSIIGDNCYIGPSSVVSNGVQIGRGAKVSLGAVATQSVAPGTTVSGNFAIDHDRFLQHIRTIR